MQQHVCLLIMTSFFEFTTWQNFWRLLQRYKLKTLYSTLYSFYTAFLRMKALSLACLIFSSYCVAKLSIILRLDKLSLWMFYLRYYPPTLRRRIIFVDYSLPFISRGRLKYCDVTLHLHAVIWNFERILTKEPILLLMCSIVFSVQCTE